MSKRRKHIKDIPLANNKNVLEVEVSYSEGGMSYFSGESSLRGVLPEREAGREE